MCIVYGLLCVLTVCAFVKDQVFIGRCDEHIWQQLKTYLVSFLTVINTTQHCWGISVILAPCTQLSGVWSRSLSFEGGCNSGQSLPHLKLCVTLLQFLWLLCNLFISQLKLCSHDCTWWLIVHLLLEEFENFSQVILKYTISMSHNKS